MFPVSRKFHNTHKTKGLWRGVGEPPLRGLYHALASSSIGHQSLIISFVKKPPPDPREYLVQPLSTSDLPNEAVFFHPELFSSRARNFQTIRGARREAGKLPRSPCFKWRAGTPYPPVYQASGTDGLPGGRSKCALLCELHERATRPTR